VKFTDAERKALAIELAPTIASWKLTTTPANREGKKTTVSPDFAAAVWLQRYVRTIVKVLEDERASGETSPPAEASSPGF